MHDRAVVGDAGHAVSVIRVLADRARHVRTVTVVIVGVGVVVGEVPGGGKGRRGQVGKLAELRVVLVPYAGIDDGHDHALPSIRAQTPGGLRPHAAFGVVQVPLVWVVRVVGNVRGVGEEAAARLLHQRAIAIGGQDPVYVRPLWNGDAVEAGEALH